MPETLKCAWCGDHATVLYNTICVNCVEDTPQSALEEELTELRQFADIALGVMGIEVTESEGRLKALAKVKKALQSLIDIQTLTAIRHLPQGASGISRQQSASSEALK